MGNVVVVVLVFVLFCFCFVLFFEKSFEHVLTYDSVCRPKVTACDCAGLSRDGKVAGLNPCRISRGGIFFFGVNFLCLIQLSTTN